MQEIAPIQVPNSKIFWGNPRPSSQFISFTVSSVESSEVHTLFEVDYMNGSLNEHW